MPRVESLIVNSSIGAPVVSVGFFYAWYLGVFFTLFVVLMVFQSARCGSK